jgi:hypothetical protein
VSAGINNAKVWLEKTKRRTAIKNLIVFMTSTPYFAIFKTKPYKIHAIKIIL